jgi:transcriptional regulator GlxA family with amidase domain
MTKTRFSCHFIYEFMNKKAENIVDVLILALPETAGSALYGMVDVLSATGNLWQALVRSGDENRRFRVRILSPLEQAFTCGHGIPVTPEVSVAEDPAAEVVILPEIWLGPDESLHGRYPAVVAWLKRKYAEGAELYSACSGSILLAETGLLDGRAATSHWGYTDLFRNQYPKVRFDPASNLVYADDTGRIVTAGGTTSWHDLALHIIARHASPGDALHIAKVYLLKWHPEGQLPYTGLVRHTPHADSIAKRCEEWLTGHFREIDAIRQLLDEIDVPERSLKRRFKAATGSTLIEYLQNLRIEEAKRLLEQGELPIDEVSEAVGYLDISFFRRLFKRLTGMPPGQYRRMFQHLRE